jgi:hypothetical protein
MVLGAALVFGVLVAASYPCTAAFSSIASAAPVAVDCDPAARPIIL